MIYNEMLPNSLIIDASTELFQVGILNDDRFIEFFSTDRCDLTGLFDILTDAVKCSQFQEVIFCEGPGKMIGIRATLMFVNILKIIRPDIKIYSYNSLALAHKIRNPLPFTDIDIMSDASEDEDDKWKNLASDPQDKDEIDAIEFKKSLQSEHADCAIVNRGNFFEDVVCVKKNATQFYMYSNDEISVVSAKELEMQDSPVYCLRSSRTVCGEDELIEMDYNIEECAEYIREISVENCDIVTKFDAQGDFAKWEPSRHK